MCKLNLANSWRRKGDTYGVLEAQAIVMTRMILREATRLAIQVKESMNEDLGDIKGQKNKAMVTSKLIFLNSRANFIRTYSLIGYKWFKESSNTRISQKAKR